MAGHISELKLRRLRLVVSLTAASALGGSVFGLATTSGSARGGTSGAFIGAVIALILVTIELFYVQTHAGRWIRQMSFVRMLAAKSVVYFAVFTLVLTSSDLILREDTGMLVRPDREFATNLAFSAAFAIMINLTMQLNRLLGRGVLSNFILGRYHKPHEEERVFLFLDLVGSTSMAERLGGPRFMELLNQLFHDIANPIIEHHGDIHKYVGDEVIITWPKEKGLSDANCVLCVFAIMQRIASHSAEYQKAFGLKPQFRAGLHMGMVVTGELGDLKQEIAFLGDTMNTTARLIDACRQHDRNCIASADLVNRLTLPRSVNTEPLGSIQLRGRSAALDLFALLMPG